MLSFWESSAGPSSHLMPTHFFHATRNSTWNSSGRSFEWNLQLSALQFVRKDIWKEISWKGSCYLILQFPPPPSILGVEPAGVWDCTWRGSHLCLSTLKIGWFFKHFLTLKNCTWRRSHICFSTLKMDKLKNFEKLHMKEIPSFCLNLAAALVKLAKLDNLWPEPLPDSF